MLYCDFIFKIYGRARRDGCPGKGLQTDGGVGAALRQKGAICVPAVVLFWCFLPPDYSVMLCAVYKHMIAVQQTEQIFVVLSINRTYLC